MKRVIRRVVTVITTETWSIAEHEDGEERPEQEIHHTARIYTTESVISDDDHIALDELGEATRIERTTPAEKIEEKEVNLQ